MSREDSEARKAGQYGNIYYCSSVRLAVFPLLAFELGFKWPESRLRVLSFHGRDLPSLSHKSAEGVEPGFPAHRFHFISTLPCPTLSVICKIPRLGEGSLSES